MTTRKRWPDGAEDDRKSALAAIIEARRLIKEQRRLIREQQALIEEQSKYTKTNPALVERIGSDAAIRAAKADVCSADAETQLADAALFLETAKHGR